MMGQVFGIEPERSPIRAWELLSNTRYLVRGCTDTWSDFFFFSVSNSLLCILVAVSGCGVMFRLFLLATGITLGFR